MDNGHLLLQHHAAIFMPASGGKIDQQGSFYTSNSY